MRVLLLMLATLAMCGAHDAPAPEVRRLGRLQEVFAWKQITYNIDGNHIVQDLAVYPNATTTPPGSDGHSHNHHHHHHHQGQHSNRGWRPTSPRSRASTTTTAKPTDESRQFFTQYNNLPMGVERVGDRLFVTVPRRRYGIPSTLNYLDLKLDGGSRSPGLRPYPSLRAAQTLTSVYRTRADHCNRLWMVDNGMLELPNNRQQLTQSSIVIFDLTTDKEILRYPLKTTDVIAFDTPAGLASITLDFVDPNDCSNVFAYIPDLETYGLIVYSLRDNDSWRLSHNYFHFNPALGNLRLSGQYFQWRDGIFSITLTEADQAGCRQAYFHPLISTNEFTVSTCVLRNKTASQDDTFWQQFSMVGDRGANGQCTIHGYHERSGAIFFADSGRDALSCWNTNNVLEPSNVVLLQQDADKLAYPSDLHVTGDEVWFMANHLPTWAYSRLDTEQYNFYIYKANIDELIAGTKCARN